MSTITIPKIEYQRLKRQVSIFHKIAEEITRAAHDYPYDYHYIDRLTRQARAEAENGKLVAARSVDEALRKFRRK